MDRGMKNETVGKIISDANERPSVFQEAMMDHSNDCDVDIEPSHYAMAISNVFAKHMRSYGARKAAIETFYRYKALGRRDETAIMMAMDALTRFFGIGTAESIDPESYLFHRGWKYKQCEAGSGEILLCSPKGGMPAFYMSEPFHIALAFAYQMEIEKRMKANTKDDPI